MSAFYSRLENSQVPSNTMPVTYKIESLIHAVPASAGEGAASICGRGKAPSDTEKREWLFSGYHARQYPRCTACLMAAGE